MQAISPTVLSSLISDIYECALNPMAWEGALTQVNNVLGTAYTTIALAHPQSTQPRMVAHSPWDPVQLKILNEEYGAEGVPGLLEVVQGGIDSPQSTIDQIGAETFYQTPFYLQWAKPQGLLDGCVTKFASSQERIGMLASVSSAKQGPITHEIRQMTALLSPHIRRASLIGDLLDFQRVQTNTFKLVLDQLAVPILLVRADGQIVYENASAARLLSEGTQVVSTSGILKPANGRVVAAFADCILRCATGNDAIGTRGLGIPLSLPHELNSQPASIAYVLPLSSPAYRESFPLAVAAVFVAQNSGQLPPQQDVLATLYDLTPTEAKVMMHAGSGANIQKVAAALAVSENTIKTHLARVFNKTGVSRQADLTQLVNALSSPL
jgi:DNA-binding CsgD family transcriptional regulator/PAS domain-containing protein